MTAPESILSSVELQQLLDEYCTGLEGAIAALRQLTAVAHRQKDAADARDFPQLAIVSDERDVLTSKLTAIEGHLGAIRNRFEEVRDRTRLAPRWVDLERLRQDTATLVTGVLAIDRTALQSLADAETAGRAALAGVEKGETTLAAYRRVVAPEIEHASLVDTRG